VIWRRLREAGVLGMNERNFALIQRLNPRRFYPRVDDKLRTKVLCAEAGVPTPELYAACREPFEVKGLRPTLEERGSFVIKPVRGSQGNGIVVVLGRRDGAFERTGGRLVSFGDLAYHVSQILSGLYSLGGQADHAIVEERLLVHPALAAACEGGVPDVRVIVYRGYPVMAMTRLPTRRSGGRANLHQGAIGAGVDLATGRTVAAVQGSRYVEKHPDTGHPVTGITIPDFPFLVESAVKASDATQLGYVGVDMVVDERRGPVVLEMNARPGLSVQLANRAGLLRRIERVARGYEPGRSVAERVKRGCEWAAVGGSHT